MSSFQNHKLKIFFMLGELFTFIILIFLKSYCYAAGVNGLGRILRIILKESGQLKGQTDEK